MCARAVGVKAVPRAGPERYYRLPGAAIDGPELGTIPLDLTARSRICAAGDEALLGRLADALLSG